MTKEICGGEGVKCPYCGKMHFDNLHRIDVGFRHWFECERCHKDFETWLQIETKYYSERWKNDP